MVSGGVSAWVYHQHYSLDSECHLRNLLCLWCYVVRNLDSHCNFQALFHMPFPCVVSFIHSFPLSGLPFAQCTRVVCFGLVGWDDADLCTVNFAVMECLLIPGEFLFKFFSTGRCMLRGLSLPIPPGPSLPTVLLTFSQLPKRSWDFLRSAYLYLAPFSWSFFHFVPLKKSYLFIQ